MQAKALGIFKVAAVLVFAIPTNNQGVGRSTQSTTSSTQAIPATKSASTPAVIVEYGYARSSLKPTYCVFKDGKNQRCSRDLNSLGGKGLPPVRGDMMNPMFNPDMRSPEILSYCICYYFRSRPLVSIFYAKVRGLSYGVDF